MLNFRSIFFQNFFINGVLWTLNCSGEEGLLTNLFWSCKIWCKKISEFLPLQSILDSELSRVVRSVHQYFFGQAKLEVKIFSEFFHLQSTLDSEYFRGGVQASTFFGHTKFEVKIF